MSDSVDSDKLVLDAIVKKRNIGQYERHILLCIGPDCCSAEQGEQAWMYLKSRLTELGLSETKVYRTKVGCLRICNSGPIGVIYPDGTWYKQLTPENLERVITDHLLADRVVSDLVFAVNELPNSQ